MENVQPSLFVRDDTMLGVCQGIGEDFGFNPSWLRAALGALLLWNPVAALSAYAAGGILVFVSRWLVPEPGLIAAPPGLAGTNDEAEAEPLAEAA